MIAVKLMLIGATVLFGRKRYTEPENKELSKKEGYSISSVRLYYLIGLLITTGGYMIRYFDRIGLYFYLFEAVYIAMLFKSIRVSKILKLAFAAICAYVFVLALYSNGQGQLPYVFVWQ